MRLLVVQAVVPSEKSPFWIMLYRFGLAPTSNCAESTYTVPALSLGSSIFTVTEVTPLGTVNVTDPRVHSAPTVPAVVTESEVANTSLPFRTCSLAPACPLKYAENV